MTGIVGNDSGASCNVAGCNAIYVHVSVLAGKNTDEGSAVQLQLDYVRHYTGFIS